MIRVWSNSATNEEWHTTLCNVTADNEGDAMDRLLEDRTA